MSTQLAPHTAWSRLDDARFVLELLGPYFVLAAAGLLLALRYRGICEWIMGVGFAVAFIGHAALYIDLQATTGGAAFQDAVALVRHASAVIPFRQLLIVGLWVGAIGFFIHSVRRRR